jgi:hypothetical protein
MTKKMNSGIEVKHCPVCSAVGWLKEDIGDLTVCCKVLTAGRKMSKPSKSSFLAPFPKMDKPWPGFGPGTFALPRQRSTRLSYQGTDTERM